MGKIFNDRYELIRDLSNENIECVYFVIDKVTKEEYIVREILQDITPADEEILRREFHEVIKNRGTVDISGISPVITDFFIEEGSKYMVVESLDVEETLVWLQAFPSLGCIFKNCYVVVCGISTGGFGVVYQIRDANIPGKYWALKEMYDDSDKPDVVERSFRTEAEMLASLDHPCIPIIVSFFTDENRHYLVMEYIKGHTLEEMVDNLEEDEYFPEEVILEWAIQICEVLEYLHKRPQPVVFRDMKPDNIIITTKEKELKLIDFGISCIFKGPKGRTTLHTLLSEGYAPQEQWLGKAEPRSDIYSLGATLHHLITKIHPREMAPDFPPPDNLNSHISRELSLIVLKAIEPKMIDRYQTISEMKQELLKIIEKRKVIEEEQNLLLQGENHEQEDNHFEALSEYMKVLDINPLSEKAHYKLGICYEKLGFKNKALEHYHKTLEVSSSHEIKEKCEERIKFFELEAIGNSLGVDPAIMMEEIDVITAKSLKGGSYLSPKDFRLTTRFGHSAGVTSVCFIPGKQWIASASKDKTIKLWDLEKEMLICNLEGHLNEVNSVCASSDGNWLVSGSSDKTAKLWELKNKTLSYVFGGYQDEVKAVSFSPDGKRLVLASNNQIHMWDLELKTLIYIFEGHHDKVKTLVFSPDGKFLFSGGNDLNIRLWDLECRKILYSFDVHPEPARAISISPEGDLMAITSGNIIKILDIGTRQLITTLEGSSGRIETVAFDPKGIYLASGDSNGSLSIWDMESGKLITTLCGHKGWVSSIGWNSEGTRIVSGSSDNTVKLWCIERKDLVRTFGGHCTSFEAIALSPDGAKLASGNSDKTIKIWNLEDRSLVSVFEKHSQVVSSLSYSPDGKLLASGSWDETVNIWDINKGEIDISIKVNSGLIGAISFSPDGKYLATGGSDNTIKLWKTRKGSFFKSFEGPDWSVETLAFSPDGKWIASGGSNNTITLWDLNNGEKLACLTGHTDSVMAISFGPKRNLLVSGSKDNTVKLWSLEGKRNITKELVYSFEGHTASVLSVCFNKKGTSIASGGKDNVINFWDIESRELLFSLSGHSSHISALCFSHDDGFLFSASRDGTVRVWNLTDRCLVYTLVALAKEDRYEYISYSPDNNYNASEGGKEHIVFERIVE